MKVFATRILKPSVLLAALTLLAAWFTWSEVLAQPADGESAEATGETRVVIPAEDIRRMVQVENERHEAVIQQLKAARDALQDAGGDATVLGQLIKASEQQHNARTTRLQSWLRTASAEQSGDGTGLLESTVNSELRDVAEAIGSLNQSFHIEPVRGKTASTGGSRDIDVDDDPEASASADEQAGQAAENGGAGESGANTAGGQAGTEQPLGKALSGEVAPSEAKELRASPGPSAETSAAENGGPGSAAAQPGLDELAKQLEAIQARLDALRSADGPGEN